MPSGNEAAGDWSDDGPSLPRLLYVASTKSRGGIEQHSVELAAALAGRGATVYFACTPGSSVQAWCREAGLPMVPFAVRNSGDLGAAWRLARLIRREQIGVVHAHSRRDYVVAVLSVALARHLLKHRAALVLHAHMIRPLGEPRRLSGRFFEWGADAVVAVSGAVRDRLLRDHQFSSDFVRLIPNGINLERYALPGSPEAARRRTAARGDLAVPDNALALGMIGRLDAKGQRQLFRVMPELLQFCPNLWLVCVGSEGKPGEEVVLTAQAEAGGFAHRIVFTGPRTDVPALLTAFDVLVHLPLDEAFGLALAEAQAAGVPAVATNIGGCCEVVQNGVTGLLVPPGDLSALSGALLRLLDPVHGRAEREEIGACGRLAAERSFSQNIQLDRLEALYRDISPAITV